MHAGFFDASPLYVCVFTLHICADAQRIYANRYARAHRSAATTNNTRTDHVAIFVCKCACVCVFSKCEYTTVYSRLCTHLLTRAVIFMI